MQAQIVQVREIEYLEHIDIGEALTNMRRANIRSTLALVDPIPESCNKSAVGVPCVPSQLHIQDDQAK